MGLNLKKALANMKKDLTKRMSIEFEYGQEEGVVWARATGVSMKGFDDDLAIAFYAFEGGAAVGWAIMDRLEPSYEALDLLNQFNLSNPYFRAVIREDGYLACQNVKGDVTEKDFCNYASSFLVRLLQLSEDELAQKLAEMTTKE